MDPVLRDILVQGGFGAILVLALLGWLEFKPVIDERKARDAEQKAVIKELAAGLTKATSIMEAENKAHHGGGS